MGHKGVGEIMAAPGTAPILGPLGANIVDNDGKITDPARAGLISNVIKILQGGNKDGKGLLLSNLLNMPMPPVSGPILPAPTLVNPKMEEPLFWFEPDPYAELSLQYLTDKNSVWNKTFVDGLYASIAKGLNLNGSYILAPVPIFDPSIYGFTFDFDLKVDLPTLAVKLPAFLLPEVPKLPGKLGIPKLEIPELPKIPPAFEIPEMPPMPQLPTIALPGIPVPSLAFPNLFLDFFFELPKIVVQLAIPSIPTSLPDLFLKPFNLIFDLFFKLLFKLNLVLTVPKLLVATILSIMHNVAVMLACDIIGLFLGTGSIVKGVAAFGNLLA